MGTDINFAGLYMQGKRLMRPVPVNLFNWKGTYGTKKRFDRKKGRTRLGPKLKMIRAPKVDPDAPAVPVIF
jgi:hypothetical protein